MKFYKIIVPIFFSVSLCACNQKQSAYVVQPITVQNEIPQSVAKKNTTKVKQKTTVAESGTIKKPSKETNSTSVPTSNTGNSSGANNSAIKDVIIDGNGNLVVAHSNGSFSSFTAPQGPMGPQGPQGLQGPQGEKGEKGDSGRGIDYCSLDDDNNLIIHYSDGSSQNVGCVAVKPSTPNTNDYEQVGYRVTNCTNVSEKNGTRRVSFNSDFIETDYSFDDVSIELTNVNPKSTYTEYTYSVNINASFSNLNVNTNSSKSCTFYLYVNLIDLNNDVCNDFGFNGCTLFIEANSGNTIVRNIENASYSFIVKSKVPINSYKYFVAG